MNGVSESSSFMDTILPLVLAAGRAYLARESALASDPLLPVAATPPRSAPRPSGASAATRAPHNRPIVSKVAPALIAAAQ